MRKLKLEKFFNESATIALITNGMRVQKKLNHALIKFDLNLNQSLILLAVFFEPEKTLRSNELGSLIPTTKGNISHCTTFLEEQKLLARKMVEGDLRGYEFSLTAKGQRICLNLVKFFDDIENTCDRKIPASKLKEFMEVVEKI